MRVNGFEKISQIFKTTKKQVAVLFVVLLPVSLEIFANPCWCTIQCICFMVQYTDLCKNVFTSTKPKCKGHYFAKMLFSSHHFQCHIPTQKASWWRAWMFPDDGWISSGASSSKLDRRIGERLWRAWPE